MPQFPAPLAAHLHLRRIPKLDALRTISALVVLLYHFEFSFFPAGLGVLIFFVISGFLITWLLLEEVDKTGTVSLPHFYFRRTFRIFPAFYVFWGITLGGLLIKHGRILWDQVVAMFLYVGNYYQGLHDFPENGFSHAWSLGVEEQYYLLWPAVVLMMACRPKRLLKFTLGAIVAVWIYRDILQFAGAPESYIYTAFDTRVDHLLIGCALAISLRYGYFARFWGVVCAGAIYMLLPFAALLLSVAASRLVGNYYRNTIGFMVDPLLIALLMAQLLATESRWLAWMDSAPLVYLGAISYSTYLYHQMAGGLAKKALGAQPEIVLIGCGIAATYTMATLSYFAVEKPFLRLRSRLEKGRGASAELVAVSA